MKRKVLTDLSASTPVLEVRYAVGVSAKASDDSAKSASPAQTDALSCSTCGTFFEEESELRLHAKSRWHVENVKLIAQGKQSIDEETFNEKQKRSQRHAADSKAGTSSDGDSSQSDSEDDKDSGGKEKDEQAPTGSPKTVFVTEAEEWSVWKAVLVHPRQEEGVAADSRHAFYVEKLKKRMSTSANKWAVLLSSGGRFAGGVFDGSGNCVAHRAFQRYTVRCALTSNFKSR